MLINFCYLGDVIGKGGGAEEASRARVRCAWGKFRDLRMLLTARGASLRVKGKIYRACVQRVLVYNVYGSSPEDSQCKFEGTLH